MPPVRSRSAWWRWSCARNLLIVDMLAHRTFELLAPPWSWACVLLAFLMSVVVGRPIDFLNYSSLHAAYAARITRCFLGATNEGRYDDEHRVLTNVQVSHVDDDVPQHLYRPEAYGGPLHLLSVCVNDTVEPHPTNLAAAKGP